MRRMGKTHKPHYRIVVMEARTKREGESLLELGFYSPFTKELVIDKEKAVEWMKKGAQPTDTVRNLFVRNGLIEKPKHIRKFETKPGRKAEERRAKKLEKSEKPAESQE